MELQRVSYKLAKMLKEIGFQESVYTYYSSRDNQLKIGASQLNYNRIFTSSTTAAPAQALAQMWFRKAHKIFIHVDSSDDTWNLYHSTHGYRGGRISNNNKFDEDALLELALLEACEVIKERQKKK